jgi:hypothetical protein
MEESQVIDLTSDVTTVIEWCVFFRIWFAGQVMVQDNPQVH